MVEVQNFTDKPTFHHAWDLKDKEAKKNHVKTGVKRLFLSISTPFFIYFPTEFFVVHSKKEDKRIDHRICPPAVLVELGITS